MKKIPIILFICFLLPAARQGSAAQLQQIAGVIHLHSTFSSGQYSLEELVEKAHRKKLEVLIPTDHDLVVMEYGLFPLRNIVKRRKERKSVLKRSPEIYLSEIRRLNNTQEQVLVLPGVQSSPFYYWTGNPLKRNLTAHDYRKELLLIGLDEARDYRHLPLLHNGLSTRYITDRLPQAILFVGALGIGICLLLHKGRFRRIGVVVGFVSALLLIDQHPFQSSPFDPYHGDKGVEPYQETIDFVRQRNGLVFWAHPESGYAASGVALGPVKLTTKPYPDDMVAARNYTGFAAVYGDTATAVEPGRHWDEILLQYCRNERDRPVWAIAGADFHVEKKGVELDTFQTVFLVQRKTAQEVLGALAGGRMYAVRKEAGPRLVLDRFRIKDPSNGATAGMGEEMTIAGLATVEGALSADDRSHHRIVVSLIRGGKILQYYEGQTPLAFEFVDREPRSKKSYYRLTVQGRTIGKLVSNPVFVMQR